MKYRNLYCISIYIIDVRWVRAWSRAARQGDNSPVSQVCVWFRAVRMGVSPFSQACAAEPRTCTAQQSRAPSVLQQIHGRAVIKAALAS